MFGSRQFSQQSLVRVLLALIIATFICLTARVAHLNRLRLRAPHPIIIMQLQGERTVLCVEQNQ